MARSSRTRFTGEEVLDILMDDDEEILNEFCFESSDDDYSDDEESIRYKSCDK